MAERTADANGKADNHGSPDDHGMRLTLRPFVGLMGDVRRRLPLYAADFKDGLHPKVLASILFLFFACFANAVAFGGLTELVTGGEIGTIEMIVATAIGGVLFALFSGQPLTILGGTGPIVIFTGLLYTTCEQFGLPFLAMYAWVGVWSGLLLIAFSVLNVSALMRYFTRFTDEIFAALIAVIFIVEALDATMHPFLDDRASDSTELLTLVLAIGTFAFARGLKNFARTPYTSRTTRAFISDFGPAIAIALMTGFALLESSVSLEQPALPDTFGTTTGRSWLVDMTTLPAWAIAAAIGPALMATILLFLDQNITTRLVNAPSHRLRKGPGFHLDLLVVGLITLAFSLFALPWIVAATVHSINHVKSLANVRVSEDVGYQREIIVSVRENRLSGLGIHLLIAASIFMLPVIKHVPMAVLFGLFLYMGVATLEGNQFFSRMVLWVTDRRLYPSSHYVRVVPAPIIHAFTGIQLFCLAALWALKASAAGILFPVLIALLVPLRFLLGRWFKPEDLEALDDDEDEDHVPSKPIEADYHA
ncbi:MAG: hypothetical protein ACI8PT_004177 [Gammaproteobacteria bacterium]|jgi:hypothetical protein